jgi:hypothetical protein
MWQEEARNDIKKHLFTYPQITVNQYISKFEELVDKADFNLYNQGTLDLFINNIRNALFILWKYMDPVKPTIYGEAKDKLW